MFLDFVAFGNVSRRRLREPVYAARDFAQGRIEDIRAADTQAHGNCR